ncbi:MAG: 4-(cytidine 5'-diphospho)-2-C-methyl-D-erythritol kinase [Terriglobia bacterium]|jgi:4-diphosphocytidyl-2-C-methyl-D-erythritol kinase|nr:4-(cytidine 5'-diphospho)-2-C-methyl-D-erythritol kinase [Terriglobia bacterium]
MPATIRSFAKINLGLAIGVPRADGFHDLRTIYQTVRLHDVLKIDIARGVGIEIRCKDPRVPADETNTCWRVAERVLKTLKQRAKVVITIEKKLPVQGGIGGGSSNAVATMLGLEKALKAKLSGQERVRIAAEVGSDLPLFLVGGTVLGCGRGEEVWPMPDLPPWDIVIATPEIGVATPEAFRRWDELVKNNGKLTDTGLSDRISKFSRSAFEWLTGLPTTGVPAKGGNRAETLLLDLVRAGIENDFERVVFPEYPELRDVKRALEREGAKFASLSGSGSTVFGLFSAPAAAEKAAAKLSRTGIPAQATKFLNREPYWREMSY